MNERHRHGSRCESERASENDGLSVARKSCRQILETTVSVSVLRVPTDFYPLPVQSIGKTVIIYRGGILECSVFGAILSSFQNDLIRGRPTIFFSLSHLPGPSISSIAAPTTRAKFS